MEATQAAKQDILGSPAPDTMQPAQPCHRGGIVHMRYTRQIELSIHNRRTQFKHGSCFLPAIAERSQIFRLQRNQILGAWKSRLSACRSASIGFSQTVEHANTERKRYLLA